MLAHWALGMAALSLSLSLWAGNRYPRLNEIKVVPQLIMARSNSATKKKKEKKRMETGYISSVWAVKELGQDRAA